MQWKTMRKKSGFQLRRKPALSSHSVLKPNNGDCALQRNRRHQRLASTTGAMPPLPGPCQTARLAAPTLPPPPPAPAVPLLRPPPPPAASAAPPRTPHPCLTGVSSVSRQGVVASPPGRSSCGLQDSPRSHPCPGGSTPMRSGGTPIAAPPLAC